MFFLLCGGELPLPIGRHIGTDTVEPGLCREDEYPELPLTLLPLAAPKLDLVGAERAAERIRQTHQLPTCDRILF